MKAGVRIAPSVLSADLVRLREQIEVVEEGGADWIHVDVMDGHFVPNLTFGASIVSAIRQVTQLPVDVHLMVERPESYIEPFADAGASVFTFHPEATNHIDRSLQLIKDGGCKAGLVFNPATPLDAAKYVLDKLDIILLMSVNPGFGGQAFIPQMLEKAKDARKLIDENGLDCRLMMDGGVKVENIKACAEAGVDMFVAGSAIFKAPRTQDAYKTTIDAMRAELDKAERK